MKVNKIKGFEKKNLKTKIIKKSRWLGRSESNTKANGNSYCPIFAYSSNDVKIYLWS